MPDDDQIHISQIKGIGILIGTFFTLINFIAAGITALLIVNFTSSLEAVKIAIQPIQQNTRQIDVNTTALQNIQHDISECKEKHATNYALDAQQESRLKNIELEVNELENK